VWLFFFSLNNFSVVKQIYGVNDDFDWIDTMVLYGFLTESVKLWEVMEKTSCHFSPFVSLGASSCCCRSYTQLKADCKSVGIRRLSSWGQMAVVLWTGVYEGTVGVCAWLKCFAVSLIALLAPLTSNMTPWATLTVESLKPCFVNGSHVSVLQFYTHSWSAL